MAKQTFLSYKYFRDSAGVSYAIFVSHDSDKVASVTVDQGSNLSIISEKINLLLDGSQENIIEYKGSGVLSVTFSSSFKQDVPVAELAASDALSQDFSSLIRSFSFSVNPDDGLGYSIVDSIYYSEGTQFGQLYIFPSSTNSHLDISATQDYYYTSDGAAAYIGSTELQNQFLNAIDYTNVGSGDTNLGRFRGEKDDGSSLSFTSRSSVTTNAPGPKVIGGIISIALTKRGAETNSVCLDPRASNYYLKGCAGNSLPCTASGAMANDCDGVALTADKINSNINIDGGCCTYAVGCETFDVSLDSTKKASSDNAADGTATFVVEGGTANYSYTIAVNNVVGLVDPTVGFAETTVSSIATDRITVSNLYTGGYTITISDSNGTACSQTIQFVVGSKGGIAEGVFGCQTGTTAINYDNTYPEDSADACVYCNDGGRLAAGTALANVLGPWVLDTGNSTTVRSISDGSGTSLNKGSINFAGIKYPEPYTVLGYPNLLQFKVAESFYSTQANPIDYYLYKMPSVGSGITESAKAQQVNSQRGDLTLSSQATLVTTVSTTGGAHIFNNRAAGEYAILVRYDVDAGAGNTSGKSELCYEIFGPFVIEQAGCTDARANNYNSNATFDDGSCSYSELYKGCTDPKALNYKASAVVDDGSCQYQSDRDTDVLGCTDPSADNYSPSANIDDGSCIYPTQGTYKCINSKCQFIQNDYTGSKTLEECVRKGCSGIETDETRLIDFAGLKVTITSSNSSSTS
jgi:hypothetical protein